MVLTCWMMPTCVRVFAFISWWCRYSFACSLYKIWIISGILLRLHPGPWHINTGRCDQGTSLGMGSQGNELWGIINFYLSTEPFDEVMWNASQYFFHDVLRLVSLPLYYILPPTAVCNVLYVMADQNVLVAHFPLQHLSQPGHNLLWGCCWTLQNVISCSCLTN